MGHEVSPLMRLCRCEHTQRRHDEDAGCKASGCGCAVFRPHGVVDLPKREPEPAPKAEPFLAGAPGRATTESFGPGGCVVKPFPGVPEPAAPAVGAGEGSLEAVVDRVVLGGGLEVVATHPDGEPVPAEVDAGPSLEDLVERGKASDDLRTRALAEKVSRDLGKLRVLLEEETVAAHARAQLAERMRSLEAELAQVRARFVEAGGVLGPQPDGVGRYPCPHDGCVEVKQSPQGLSSHRRSAHGWRKGDDDAAGA